MRLYNGNILKGTAVLDNYAPVTSITITLRNILKSDFLKMFNEVQISDCHKPISYNSEK